ncbi:hypothetical protein [Brevibacterium yomogidense]|uniref:hypothetical protein n=1 Tax=Brevibacterium yomogidense TaxID=946573 RepID=UPI0018E043CF|nr:hypothetical protein [Brevibacterium yomogidense]
MNQQQHVRAGPAVTRSWILAELPVAVLLALAALSVAWPGTHLAASVLWLLAVVWNVQTRVIPSLRNWVTRRRPSRLRLASSRLVLVLAAAVTVSGIARWAGASPSQTWHGGLSWTLLTAVALRVALVKGATLRRRPNKRGPGR